MGKNQTRLDKDIPSRKEIEQKLKKLSEKIDKKYRELSGTVTKTKEFGSSVKRTFNGLTAMAIPLLRQAKIDMEIRILLKQKIKMDIEILRKKMEATKNEGRKPE